MKSVKKTLRRFDIWSVRISLIALVGILFWQSLKRGFVFHEFLFILFVFSPAFVFLFFVIRRATRQDSQNKRRFFYLYLQITGQAKRLIFQKVKDGSENFKHLHPKWRDDEKIADLAVRLDLGNMAWCGECFREDLEFIIKAYSYWNIKIQPTTIRDVYFAFLCVDAKTPISKRFFWGRAIVKFFKRPDIEFAAERILAERLFCACASGEEWFVADDNEASVKGLKRSYPSFSEASYRQALAITRHRSMKGPPDWIW